MRWRGRLVRVTAMLTATGCCPLPNVTLSNPSPATRDSLDRAVAFIEDLHLAEVTHADFEILQLPYESDAAEGEVLEPED